MTHHRRDGKEDPDKAGQAVGGHTHRNHGGKNIRGGGFWLDW